MVLFSTKKAFQKVISHLLNPGEEVTAVTFQGGFTQTVIGTTTKNRLIICKVGTFSSKPKEVVVDCNFKDVKRIDLMSGKMTTKLIMNINNTEYTFKIYPRGGSSRALKNSGLDGLDILAKAFKYDPAEDAFKIYNQIVNENPKAIPEYLEKDEQVLFAFKAKNEIVKMTDKNFYFFDEEKNNFKFKEKISIDSLSEIDIYLTKSGAKYYIKLVHANTKRLIEIGGFFSLTKDSLNVSGLQEADQKLEEVIELPEKILRYVIWKNPSCKPMYLEAGELPEITLRAAHSKLAVFGGTILRLTNKRLLELKLGDDNNLNVVKSYYLKDINKINYTVLKEGLKTKGFEYFVYLNTGEKIKYYLSLMGANEEKLDYITDKIEKVRNSIN